MPKTNQDFNSYAFFKAYGNHCMAYSGFEPRINHFVCDDLGYIAHSEYWHWLWCRKPRQIVICDPVCAPENYLEITRRFLEKYPLTLFVGVSREYAKVLQSLGLQVNEFGHETDIPLEDFNLRGKHRAKLRQWQNKCKREGLTVTEASFSNYSNKKEISDLSKEWLKHKHGEDLGLLFRPLRIEDEQDVRRFMGFIDNKLIGFAIFDPIYFNGKVIAYYHNIDRIADEAPHGTSASIILAAIEVFKKEGLEYVALGMSPLKLREKQLWELPGFHRFTRKSFWYAFEKLNFLYPFQGNASHKKKFNGETKPVYLSGTKGTNLWEVFLMLKAIGML